MFRKKLRVGADHLRHSILDRWGVELSYAREIVRIWQVGIICTTLLLLVLAWLWVSITGNSPLVVLGVCAMVMLGFVGPIAIADIVENLTTLRRKQELEDLKLQVESAAVHHGLKHKAQRLIEQLTDKPPSTESFAATRAEALRFLRACDLPIPTEPSDAQSSQLPRAVNEKTEPNTADTVTISTQ